MAFSSNRHLVILFAAFYGFYTSSLWRSDGAIRAREARRILEDAGMPKENAKKMVKDALPLDDDDGRSFLMLNLVKQRKVADYGSRPDLKPDHVKTGQDADRHYASIFVPKILKRACHPVFVNHRVASLPIMFPLPKDDNSEAVAAFSDWDYFGLVRYRSMRDLIEAVAEITQEYGSDAMMALKNSGVERTYVIPIYSNAPEYVLTVIMLIILWWRRLR